MQIIRNQRGRFTASPEENVPVMTLQASCKRFGTRLRSLVTEAAIGLIWALVAFISIAVLLSSDAGMTDFRYVGF